MPASNERIPERNLSGLELAEIMKRDFAKILSLDGMLSNNISYGRVSFDIRVSMHLDNAAYPEHVAHVLSRPPSKQELAAKPELAAVEPGGPLKEPSDEDIIHSTELSRKIESPNAARVENELPLKVMTRDPATGGPMEKDIKYVGDAPDHVSLGNTIDVKDTTEDQAKTWGKPTRPARRVRNDS